MINKIVEELQSALKKFDSIVGKNDKSKGLEEANNKFKKLVKDGIIKERGNNLLSVDEKHLHKIDSYKVNF